MGADVRRGGNTIAISKNRDPLALADRDRLSASVGDLIDRAHVDPALAAARRLLNAANILEMLAETGNDVQHANDGGAQRHNSDQPTAALCLQRTECDMHDKQ